MIMVKRLVAKLICSSIVGNFLRRIFDDRIPINGLIIDTHAVTGQTCASLFWGLYESAEVRFIERYLHVNQPVIELGSSLGVISCLIRRRVDPKYELICVEANPQIVGSLKANLQTNNLMHNVCIFQQAIDYMQSEVMLNLGASNTTPMIAQDRQGDILVTTLTLSKLLSDKQIATDYTLVADIEGAEAGIIYEDKIALENCRQIIIELHSTYYEGQYINSENMIDQLSSYGYRLCDRYGSVCVFEK